MAMTGRIEKTAAALVAAVGVVSVLWGLNSSRTTDGTPSALPQIQAQAQPQSVPVAAEKPKVDALPHDKVAAGAPTKFTITGPSFTVNADVCGMDPVFPLDPPGDQLHTVCWVTHGFGVAPGSATNGSTYVLGHSWAAEKLVLNPLSEYAAAHQAKVVYTSTGVAVYSVPSLKNYKVTLKTANGTLGYTVSGAYLVGKLDARGIQSLMNTSTPNRVVIITCAVAHGVDLPQNVILYAKLAWSKAKT